MNKSVAKVCLLSALFFSLPSQALEMNDIHWFTSLGYEMGGEKYATGTYVPSGVTENAYANDGWHIAVGGMVPNNPEKTLETQFSIGYKFGGPNGNRSGIIWNSVPIELTQYYRQGNWRAGVGLAYHINTFVELQNANQASEIARVNNGLGYLASASYAPLGYNYAMELRYTYLRQTPADQPDLNLRASVFGAALHYRF